MRDKNGRFMKGQPKPKGAFQFVSGHKVSDETKRKISNSHIGIKHKEESKIKIGLASKGRKWSEEDKKKLSKLRMGHVSYTKGKHWKLSEEICYKLSKLRKGKFAKELASNWQGGKSFEPYSVDWTETLRISIRERDKYTCQICGKKQGDRAFSVHHIDYNKLNNNTNNLITLCINCHIKTNYNREYWTEYFKLKTNN